MASSKGSQNVRSYIYSGKHALLPPKIPFPSVSASCTEYIPSGLIGSKPVQKSREEKTQHQRTSSESHLLEEQPFWLDDLLNEPESPVRRCGHRRSSSDSFAYLDMANTSNMNYSLQNDNRFRSIVSAPQRESQEFDHNKNARESSFYADACLLKQKNRLWDSSVASGAQPGSLLSTRENIAWQTSGRAYMSQEADRVSSSPAEMKNAAEALSHDPTKASPEIKNSNPKPTASEADNTKRAKQQFAQRSRVRKLQYIAELERNVQALQAEGSEVSGELEFLNQRNLILSMENKALKKRLESLAQEKLIKHLEQEVLEREIGRLRALYQQQQQQQEQQQQQQPQRPLPNHRRASSKDLDSQFANLSLKSKDSYSSRDPVSVTGQFRI